MLSVFYGSNDKSHHFMPQRAEVSVPSPVLPCSANSHNPMNGPINMKRLAIKLGMASKAPKLPKNYSSEKFIQFYREEWKVGQQVKAKRSDHASDLLIYAGVITAVNAERQIYEVQFADGQDFRVMPRSSIFPPAFTSAIPNVEKWIEKIDELILGLFMVDYPLPLKKTPSTEISSEILDFMYIGSKESSEDRRLLRSLDISVVLRVHANPLPLRVASMYEKLGIKVYTIAIWDVVGVSIKSHWESAMPLLHACRNAGKKVLVHCEAGRSRSGSIGLAYVMTHGNPQRKLSLSDALHTVRACRDDVFPNPSFWKALIDYEQDLLGTTSMPPEAVDDLHAYNWHYFD